MKVTRERAGPLRAAKWFLTPFFSTTTRRKWFLIIPLRHCRNN
jgi:hypothetical protein